MHALLVDPSAPCGLRLGEAADPEPDPGQVLVQVYHASLNPGELGMLAQLPTGHVGGYDAAGVVVRPAADGTGPAAGTRVLAFGPGAWAELLAVRVADVAPLPDAAALAEAAALPMAGMTALRTLRAAGSLLGRRVLITGATGAVGRYGVQLAFLSGAHVVASVRDGAQAPALAALGAHEVVVGLTGLRQVSEPFDVVLETVGGPHLVAAWALLAPGAILHSIGWAGAEPAVFPAGSTFFPGQARTLSSFGDAAAVGADLSLLAGLLASGALSAQVGWRGSWERAEEAIGVVRERKVAGKVVVDITGAHADEPGAGPGATPARA
ncbi:zinc-binding dehydrogenase [Streptosporangium sp. NPDC006930]|uniref:zinc-binding dehydrogenase n=1 Tax=unclassified Streptosporangium TaxID=2632669 RepID=UPI00342B3EFB